MTDIQIFKNWINGKNIVVCNFVIKLKSYLSASYFQFTSNLLPLNTAPLLLSYSPSSTNLSSTLGLCIHYLNITLKIPLIGFGYHPYGISLGILKINMVLSILGLYHLRNILNKILDSSWKIFSKRSVLLTKDLFVLS